MEHRVIYLLVLVAAGGAALRWGGAPERVGALMFAASNLLTPVVRVLVDRYVGATKGYLGVEPGVFILDLLTLLGLLWLVAAANRFWPIWAAAIHVDGIFGHLAKALAPGAIDPLAYYLLVSKGGYAIWAVIAIATWRHWVRQKMNGVDRSWRISSPA